MESIKDTIFNCPSYLSINFTFNWQCQLLNNVMTPLSFNFVVCVTRCCKRSSIPVTDLEAKRMAVTKLLSFDLSIQAFSSKIRASMPSMYTRSFQSEQIVILSKEVPGVTAFWCWTLQIRRHCELTLLSTTERRKYRCTVLYCKCRCVPIVSESCVHMYLPSSIAQL